VSYRLHPEAAAEHKRQIAYYEEKQAGLGRRYHAEYQAEREARWLEEALGS
jgi:hypothetical protein